MKRKFEIEFDDEMGPLWMNKSNLLICLTNTCRNSKFTVRDITGDECDPSPESAGPVNPRKSEREKEEMIAAILQVWIDPQTPPEKVFIPDVAFKVVEKVMSVIYGPAVESHS